MNKTLAEVVQSAAQAHSILAEGVESLREGVVPGRRDFVIQNFFLYALLKKIKRDNTPGLNVESASKFRYWETRLYNSL